MHPLAYTAVEAARLTGVGLGRLHEWDRSGFFAPEFDRVYGRVYSFRDLVSLRTIAKLRERVSLQELRKVGRWIRAHGDAPWAKLSFAVAGRRVYLKDPDTGKWITHQPKGQYSLIRLEPISEDVASEAAALTRRGRSHIGRIERKRGVLHGAARVAGTRIPTAAIAQFAAAGYSVSEILREYPSLTEDDVQAALLFEQERHKEAG